MAQDKVRFRVGGKIFDTSQGTIANGGRNSLLAAMTSSLWQRPDAVADSLSEANELFIDRNPAYFSVLLDLLRTGELHIPVGMSETALIQEALYYGVLDQVRAAKYGPLNGDNLARIALVRGCGGGRGQAGEQPWSAIEASADGGCSVARNAVVRTYDWTLQQQAVLNIDYEHVSDIAYMGTQRIVVGTYDFEDGAMACFDASSGEIVHRYQARHDGQLWSFDGGGIATSEGQHVFASCRYQDEQAAIGTWDHTTGQQLQMLSFTDLPIQPVPTWIKLQWLPESNLLMMVTTDDSGSCIRLLDMREHKIGWPHDGALVHLEDEELLDVVAMEDCSTIAVVVDSQRLGFIDVRGASDHVLWGEPGDVFDQSLVFDRPALAYWGSQLFASMDKAVHVLSSHNWKTYQGIETAMFQRAGGGRISDISIGGNRLFVLHEETDSFEVCETPRKRRTSITGCL